MRRPNCRLRVRNSIPPSKRHSRRHPSYRLRSLRYRPRMHNGGLLGASARPLRTPKYVLTSLRNFINYQLSFALTDESSGSLLDDLHTKRSGHMGLVAVAFDGNVLGLVESGVCSTAVHSFGVLLGGALIASDRKAWTPNVITLNLLLFINRSFRPLPVCAVRALWFCSKVPSCLVWLTESDAQRQYD